MVVQTNESTYVRQLEDTLELFEERIAELEFATEDKGWERINSGEFNFELSKSHLDSIVARSRLYFLTYPLINRAVTLQADYVFAQGVNIHATNDEVNNVIQKFLDDKQNQREISGHQARLMKEQTLMVDGNVFLVLFTDAEDTGNVQVRSILVEEITDIITNPDDQNEIWFYKRAWTSREYNPKSKSIETELKEAYYPDLDYLPMNKPRSMGDIPIIWNAPIYHVNVGALSKSRFGVPEVYAALDWAQAHKNFLQDWATIVRAYAQFAFKLTTPGGKNAVAAAKARLTSTVSTANAIERNPGPIPGSTFIAAKDGANIEPIKTAGATTNASDGREIRTMVAAALGIPDTFFGSVDVGNLATARTLDRPTELKFKSRQTLWQEVYQNILNHVIKWAIIAPNGKLKNKVKLTIEDGKLSFLNREPNEDINNTKNNFDTHVEVAFPPILEHSIIDRINAVANAVTLNGKTFSVESPELAKITIRLMFQALGVADVDEIMGRIISDIDTLPQPSRTNSNNDPNNGTMPDSAGPEIRDDER